MSQKHPFHEFVNPYLGDLLQSVALDKRFVQGTGTELVDADGRHYLDFLAGYGAVPFGHNSPAIWAAITAQQGRAEPGLVQPSFLEAAGELAERLVSLAPGDLRYVCFANSGAEAVEAALKACRAATGRWEVITTQNSFHGKTLGALSATAAEHYQAPFGGPVDGYHVVPYGDIEALAATLAARGTETAAVILEPIQGEGGVHVPSADYLPAVRELCDQYGVLLILDEVQTGLGRTGELFASEASGVQPDCLTLAKALGGGLVPIGACLLNQRSFSEAFALKHSSTFAGNSLACRVGLASLELLTSADSTLLESVKARGQQLREGLETLVARYPEVLDEVRGEGLLLGLVFSVSRADYPADWGTLLGVLGEQNNLLPLVASHLLEVHGIRTAPTLNHQNVLRIEPPLTVSEAECETFLNALEETVELLAIGDSANFTRHLVPDAKIRIPQTPPGWQRRQPRPAKDGDEGRFAFLMHPLDVTSYLEFDQSLRGFDRQELSALASRVGGHLKPFVRTATRIESVTGERAYGEFIVLPPMPAELAKMSREEAVALVAEGVDLARERGAQIVGLGGYTSVITGGGALVSDRWVALTTGNSYTVVSAMEAVALACEQLGLEQERCQVAVVGAGGAIGAAATRLLLPRVGGLTLVGNPNDPDRTRQRFQEVLEEALVALPGGIHGGELAQALNAWQSARGKNGADHQSLAGRLLDTNGVRVPLRWSTDPAEALADCDIVVVATSSTEKLVQPAMLKPGAVVCDLSRPSNVSRRLLRERPDVLVLDGGIVGLPGRPDLNWNFGFPRGLAYACMAETMLLALDRHYQHTSLGRNLDLATQQYLSELATQHGFALGGLRSFDRPLGEADWEQLLEARRAVVPSSYPVTALSA